MKLTFTDSATHGSFTVIREDSSLSGSGIIGAEKEPVNTIVCNLHQDQRVVIDKVPYLFPANSVLPLVANQHFKFEDAKALTAWQFNRNFYCIADHDAEVGCVGFLFYGIEHPLFVKLCSSEADSICQIEKMCLEDMETCDNMQGEMLRTLLKRLIIKITRIAKKQTANYDRFSDEKLDTVRMFNLLLEGHYRSQHEVQFYANALNKSPKTLANLFAIFGYAAPSKLIQRRIILEAKRYLSYTDISAKEISYALGFLSPAHFSHFFKQNTGCSISDFRNRQGPAARNPEQLSEDLA